MKLGGTSETVLAFLASWVIMVFIIGGLMLLAVEAIDQSKPEFEITQEQKEIMLNMTGGK